VRFLAAAVQLNSTSSQEANLEVVERLLERAAGYGAQFVATPENTAFLGPHEEKVRRAETLDGPLCRQFAAWAAQHELHLLLGSFAERSDDPARCYNTSVLFAPDGRQLARYRKIHLFDVDLPAGPSFRETATVVAGTEIGTVDTDLGRLGLSICYDLRFGELYRHLARGGSQILTVPSAFTHATGKDHWLALLRARAIETQCFVVAPAQWGRHDDEGLRESWGHSAIVDPWGHVLADAGKGTGLALAEIDLERVRAVREAMPIAEHRRLADR
jgi:predicted amidohydrolase